MSIDRSASITVPRALHELTERFASRAGKVEEAEGFEAFELLRPNDDRDQCLVVTRWRSEEDFQAWLKSADFAAGHSSTVSGDRWEPTARSGRSTCSRRRARPDAET